MTSIPDLAPCPMCRAEGPQRVDFTWWGSVLGPKLLTHVRCGSCQTTYNGRTGRSNNKAIAVYLVVTNLIGVGILIAYFW